MAFYDNSQPWSAGPGPAQRQPSWEQPPPPSRSGTSSTGAREEPNAFIHQMAEVERAIDNLVKSGKMPFGFFGGPMYNGPGSVQRGGSDYDGRPHSNSGLQNYYQNQRYGPRPGSGVANTEQGQMEQAKRRMAAQRERELRNYHQEQQYAKTLSSSGPKSDRSMSPNTGMSEEERRELIARQHRALYGNESSLYNKDGSGGQSRPNSQDARNVTAGPRGGSPLAYDPFGMQHNQAATGGEGAVQMPQREQHGKDNQGADEPRANNTSSPATNQNSTFGMYENAQQSNRTSNSSPTGGSPPGSKGANNGGNVAPIGTRPAQPQGPVQGLQKRSRTPLPSPLSYGFSASDQAGNERSTSASSNPSQQEKGNVGLSGWGSNSGGVWGTSKSGLGVQASVWG